MSMGQSQLFLGSEDIRNGASLGVGYEIPFRRLRFRRHTGELLLEGYGMKTHSGGASGQPPNNVNSIGLLAMARYRGNKIGNVTPYLELGWGLQYSDRRSVDLNSRLNSTPTAGLGFLVQAPGGEAAFGVRVMHVSNAGLVGDNQGQNILQATMSVKF